jgi:hypothetical protein
VNSHSLQELLSLVTGNVSDSHSKGNGKSSKSEIVFLWRWRAQVIWVLVHSSPLSSSRMTQISMLERHTERREASCFIRRYYDREVPLYDVEGTKNANSVE